MLIRVTNKCNMWCSHCFIEGLTREDHHMSMETFDQVLNFADRLGPIVLTLSGGEPTLHPKILEIIDKALSYGKGERFSLALTTNGTWWEDNPKLGRKLMERAGPSGRLYIQITNDDRYYPRKIEIDERKLEGRRISFTDRIAGLYPCDRVTKLGLKQTTRAPSCFNIRSLTKAKGLRAAIDHLHWGLGRFCTPSVNIDGTVRAGETDWCRRIGTVTDSIDHVGMMLQHMRCCDKCDRLSNLDHRELSAIGEQRLVTLNGG